MLHLFCCYSAIVFYLLQYFILQFLAIQAKKDTRGGFYSFTLGRISTQLQNDAFGLQNGAFNCSESDGVFLGSEKDLS